MWTVAKVGVVGSNPIARSSFRSSKTVRDGLFVFATSGPHCRSLGVIS